MALIEGLDYAPEIPDHVWAAVGPFVIAAVDDAEGRTVHSRRSLLLAVSRLAAWSWRAAGLELERAVIFSRRNIDRFAAAGLPEFASHGRSNIRGQLLRVGETLLDPSRVATRLRAIGPSEPTEPYRDSDVAALIAWAGTQRTADRRRCAGVLLSLGLGAGLSASEIGQLRVRDIRVDNVGVMASVSQGRVRDVPVLSRWEPALVSRSAADPDDYAFRPGRDSFPVNLISNFVGRKPSGPDRPQTQRMRTTWIVGHLARRVPLVALVNAAGVDSLEAFTRFMRFVPATSEAEARRLLVGPDLQKVHL